MSSADINLGEEICNMWERKVERLVMAKRV
jgi:hypothetical protein